MSDDEMYRVGFVAYKLLRSGDLEPIKAIELPDNLVSVNILVIYFIRNKRLYIWVGQNAPRDLQNQIPNAEDNVLKRHPDFKVLRHFTLDGEKFETQEMLDMLKISKEKYKAKLEEFESFRQDQSKIIDTKKSEAQYLLEKKEYDAAVTKSDEIVEIANKIFDQETIDNQKDFKKKVLQEKEKADKSVSSPAEKEEILTPNERISSLTEEEPKQPSTPKAEKKDTLIYNNLEKAAESIRLFDFTEAEKYIEEADKLAEDPGQEFLRFRVTDAKNELLDKRKKYEKDLADFEKNLKQAEELHAAKEWEQSIKCYMHVIHLLPAINKQSEEQHYRELLDKVVQDGRQSRQQSLQEKEEKDRKENEAKIAASIEKHREYIKNAIEQKNLLDAERTNNELLQLTQKSTDESIRQEGQNYYETTDKYIQYTRQLTDIIHDVNQKVADARINLDHNKVDPAKEKLEEALALASEYSLTEQKEKISAMLNEIKGIDEEEERKKQDGQKQAELEAKIALIKEEITQALENKDLDLAEKKNNEIIEIANEAPSDPIKTEVQGFHNTTAEYIASARKLKEAIIQINNELPNAQAKINDNDFEAADSLLSSLEKTARENQLAEQEQKIAELRTQFQNKKAQHEAEAAEKAEEEANRVKKGQELKQEIEDLKDLINNSISNKQWDQAEEANAALLQKATELEDEKTKSDIQQLHDGQQQIIVEGKAIEEAAQKIETLSEECDKSIEALNFEDAEKKLAELQENMAKIPEDQHPTSIEALRAKLEAQQADFKSNTDKIAELETQSTQEEEVQNWDAAIEKNQAIIGLLPAIKRDAEIPAYQERIDQLKQKKAEMEQQKAVAELEAKEAAENTLLAEIKQLESEANAALAQGNYDQVKSLCTQITEKSEGSTSEATKSEAQRITSEFNDKIEKEGQRQETLKQINEKQNIADEQAKAGNFDQAEAELGNALQLAENIDDKEKVAEIKGKQAVIASKKRENADKQAVIDKLIKIIDENEAKKQWLSAIDNTTKLIGLFKESENPDKQAEYEQKLEEFKKKKADQDQKRAEEERLAREKAKELEAIFVAEKDVLPNVEEFSIEEVLGNISLDAQEIFEKLDNVLAANRVEVKNEATSKSVLKTADGETVEVEKTTEIKASEPPTTADTKPKAPISYTLSSGFDNNFDSFIEEAILEDIIPYNFEITEIKLNGESPKSEPEKALTKDGLQVKWTLHNIAPQEKVAIDYEMIRPVTRTGLVPLQTQLKVIKTHTNVNPLKLEGLYNAQLQFKNEFHQSLQSLVIEDIIPPFYIYDVKKPTEDLPGEMEEKSGTLVKWQLRKLEENSSTLHLYQLLDLYRYEELKIKVTMLEKKAYEQFQACELIKAEKKYKEIVSLLNDYY